MATAYWCGGDSGNETDIDVAANYVDSANGTTPFGSVPDSDDHVIFQSLALSNVSHNCTINANIEFYSIKTEAGSTLTGNASYTITVVNETSDYATKIDGTMASTPNFTINTTVDTRVDVSDGGPAGTVTFLGEGNKQLRGTPTITNFIINHASSDNDTSGAVTITGDFTITAGIFDTGADHALTVNGATEVKGTLTLNGSDCSFGDGGYTGHYGLRAAGSSATITADADSTVAMSSLYSADNAGNNIALSGTNTINKYRASNDMMIRLTNNTVDSDMTLTVTTTEADKLMQVADANVTLILTASSGTPARKIADSAMSLKELTITNGTLDTDSSNDYALTVTGGTVIGPDSGAANQATLTCNDSDISLGASYTSGWGLLVERGGTFIGGGGTHTMGAINISAGEGHNDKAFLTFTDDVTTITSAYSDRFFEITSGTIDNGSGTITLDNATSDMIQWLGVAGDAGPHKLILNNAGMYIKLRNALTVLNDLIITAGTLSTQYDGTDYKDLTVTGSTTLAGTLALNGSTCLFNTGGTAGGIILNSGGHVTADADSTVTLGSIIATTESPVGITLSGTNTINKYYSSGDGYNNRIIHAMAGTVDGATLFIITTTDADKGIAVQDTDCSLTFTPASSTSYFLDDSANIATLTISANATLTTLDGGTNRNLTVTGLVNIGGTLTGNGSAIWMGGLLVGSSGKYSATTETTTITSEDVTTGYAWDVNGTDSFDNNDGTVLFDLPASMDSHIRTGQADGANSFHHLTVLLNASTNTLTLRPNGGTVMTIEGDLTVQEGILQKNTHSHTLTVTEDVSIESGGKIDAASASGVCNFRSLTIASGGTYNATTGITALTGETDLGECLDFKSDSTFTANSGKIKFDTSASTRFRNSSGENLYDLEIDGGGQIYFYTAVNVDNDLTITDGNFVSDSGSGIITVVGGVTITDGILGYLAGSWNAAVELGSLTIAADGTYQATSGTTTLLGNFNNSGTFTHNSGKVKFSNTNDADVAINNTGTVEPVFYNLSNALETTGRLDAQDDITVINILDLCDGITTRSTIIGANVVLTMGNDSQSGYIRSTTASKPLQTGTDCIIQGANVLYPAIIESSVDLEYIAYFSNCSLKWIDIQQDWTTAGQGRTITLTGDCEFDAVTVTNGDALDLNGQRIETSGVLTIAALSSIDTPTNSLMVLGGAIDYDGSGWANGNKVDIMFTGAGATNDFAGQDYKTIMFNGTGENALNWATYFGTTNFIVASDFTPGHDFRCTDLTIATGATFDADVDEHQIAGDFNMAGGLIGRSAFEGNGTDTIITLDSEIASDTTSTVEFWINPDATGWDMILGGTANNIGYWYYNNGIIIGHAGGNTNLGTGGGVIPLNKWSNVVITHDGGTASLYVNGKLVDTGAVATPPPVKFIGADWASDAERFDGTIGRVSVWSAALTVTQIRDMMFKNFTDATTTNCVGWWQFDEGSLTDVADSSTSGNDGTMGAAAWAEAGTFTQGTSTVDLTGTGELILKGTVGFYNLKCAAATETTTVRGLSSITIGIKNNIYVGDGTLTRTGGNPSWRFAYDTTDGSAQTLGGTVVSGATYPVDLHNTYVNYYHDTTLVKEVKWNYFIGVRGCTFSANQESTGYTSWDGGSATYDYGNYTLKADHAKFGGSNGTVNFDAGKLWLTNTIGLTASTASDNFTCGPGGTVSGSSAATTFKSQNNWSVVGKIENLNVTNEELNVTGEVINCTGEIHQWHPALDDAQQLDRDTAEDRDINLGRDLDKNTELVG